jgi:hypothetical protein
MGISLRRQAFRRKMAHRVKGRAGENAALLPAMPPAGWGFARHYPRRARAAEKKRGTFSSAAC